MTDNRQSKLKTMRILSLFERFNKGEIIKKKAEAERFGVSEKTIGRDIEDLNIYLAEFIIVGHEHLV